MIVHCSAPGGDTGVSKPAISGGVWDGGPGQASHAFHLPKHQITVRMSAGEAALTRRRMPLNSAQQPLRSSGGGRRLRRHEQTARTDMHVHPHALTVVVGASDMQALAVGI